MKACQYGPLSPRLVCGAPAVTKRPRFGWKSGETWDLCEAHAAFLDRLRANVAKHSDLLRKLAER